MRKWLIQMVAVVAAFTVLAVAVCFSGDSVAVVNPSGIVSIGGTLGNVRQYGSGYSARPAVAAERIL